MDQKIRRIHPAAFKAKVALEAIKEQRTIAELSSLYGVHPTQITKWKRQALDVLSTGFSEKQKQKEHDDRGLIQELYQQIGRLKVEVDFLKKRWASSGSRNNLSPHEIALHSNKTEHVLPKGIQAELMDISRSSLYYQPRLVKPGVLLIMNRIDEEYTAHPFYGSRRMAKERGINRKQARRLMGL